MRYYFRCGEPQHGKLTHENLYIRIVAADSRLLDDVLRAYNENKTTKIPLITTQRTFLAIR